MSEFNWLLLSGIVGGVCGEIFGHRPTYGFARGVTTYAIVSIANTLFGSAGFYTTLVISASGLISEAAKMGNVAVQNDQEPELIAVFLRTTQNTNLTRRSHNLGNRSFTVR